MSDQDTLLSKGVACLDDALQHLVEVKSEIGVDMACKVYKAIRLYEKHVEKQLKKME